MDVQGYINVCGYITLPVRVLPHCLPCTQTPPQHRERKTARTLQMSRLKLSAKKGVENVEMAPASHVIVYKVYYCI